ncbi:MAG: NTP transferase domain-containing protein [Provencibacterium sp.]|nr:NTP transferase domain-containing protein [Provencibacterium sp.]
MKAVIMAGGEGSRLRPLTLDTPKPMTRLCGKPVIEYILALLKRHGVTDCVLSAGYLQNELLAYLEARQPDGLSIRLAGEEHPLGTAGGVKNAVGLANEEILVMSGDALCDIDLSAALKRHRDSGAAATLVVKQVEDPREYGLILTSEEGLVTGFIEKPPLSQATTNLANTGIYILSPETLELIPPGEKYDFAGDLFPRMLAQHKRLSTYRTAGYWCDIGELQSYLQCQYDLLQGRIGGLSGPVDADGNLFTGDRPAGDYRLHGPVYIGKNVRIGHGAQIYGPCVLEDEVSVGANAQIEGGVLLEGAFIGESARLYHALVCKGASVKWGATMHQGSVAGAHAVVGNSAKVEPGVKIWPYRHTPDGAVVSRHLITQSGREGLFDDEGIVGEIGVELTPELFARLGCAVGSIDQRQPVAIACCDTRPARALLQALSAGIQSSGAQVMDFGPVYRSLFQWSLTYTGGELGIYIGSGPSEGAVTLLGRYALGCAREVERKIEGFLSRGEFARADAAHFGERICMDGMQALYASHLLRQAPYGLNGMQARVQSANRSIAALMCDTLQGLGCETEGGPLFRIDPDGMQVAVTDSDAGELLFGRLQCMLALSEFLQKRDVAVSHTAPQLIDRLADEHGRKVYRYLDCPAGETDARARSLAARQGYFRDALMMTVRLLSFCKVSGMSLSALSQAVPDYGTRQGELAGIQAPAVLMDKLAERGKAVGEGLLLQHKLGVARIRPNKRGDRIRVFAESRSAEIAEELCADVLAYLDKLDKGMS